MRCPARNKDATAGSHTPTREEPVMGSAALRGQKEQVLRTTCGRTDLQEQLEPAGAHSIGVHGGGNAARAINNPREMPWLRLKPLLQKNTSIPENAYKSLSSGIDY